MTAWPWGAYLQRDVDVCVRQSSSPGAGRVSRMEMQNFLDGRWVRMEDEENMVVGVHQKYLRLPWLS